MTIPHKNYKTLSSGNQLVLPMDFEVLIPEELSPYNGVK
jgi:hypothetical protein